MRVEGQPAFVLHARAWRETSLLLEIFSRDHGRVGLVARGVRRERSRWPRGLLQPLQPLLLDWVARGELGTLVAAEAASASLQPQGQTLLAAMYVNEFVLRLSGRGDPHPQAFSLYAQCLARLADEDAVAWTLRRFERDFLAEIGYGLVLERAADGSVLQPELDYGYDPEEGARLWSGQGSGLRISGAALLALAADVRPPAEGLRELRGLVRAVVRHLIGGELKSWRLARSAAAPSR
ncbi:MAG: DNA repair protein RecO [Flavobacteriales bacterium]|uniref:DNA repair protein RecO n=1 Tax=Dokdonella sp. TaxID=2291710 RepID=UPI001DA42406|nr:DNA repair protein RecO [Dokdonella sp.]MBZ0205299.1 DNA repair protein RecO [Flavobacteriales bacterium]